MLHQSKSALHFCRLFYYFFLIKLFLNYVALCRLCNCSIKVRFYYKCLLPESVSFDRVLPPWTIMTMITTLEADERRERNIHEIILHCLNKLWNYFNCQTINYLHQYNTHMLRWRGDIALLFRQHTVITVRCTCANFNYNGAYQELMFCRLSCN